MRETRRRDVKELCKGGLCQQLDYAPTRQECYAMYSANCSTNLTFLYNVIAKEIEKRPSTRAKRSH